jgi:hypothetical protein
MQMSEDASDDAIDADDIAEYLESADDFAFEREIYTLAKGLSLQPQHAALYTDPVTQKMREFDIRAWGGIGVRRMGLAIECKGLKPEYPLLVSCVPRDTHEAGHEYLYADRSVGAGGSHTRVQTMTPRIPYYEYRAGEGVGKSMRQVRRDRKKDQMVAGDEVFDKWTQALSSIGEMIEEGANTLSTAPQNLRMIAFLPVLVVPDGTLWIADYSSRGDLQRPPFQHTDVTYFLGRKYWLKREQVNFTISHLHIITRTAIRDWLSGIANGGGIWDDLMPISFTG